MHNNIPKNVKYFFIILGLSYVTNLYLTTTDIFLVVTFIITGFYFHLKGLKYDSGLIYIIIFFIFINFINVFLYGMFQITALIGMILRLLIPYYIIKILNEDFFSVFENTIYFLAILSVPFYLLQLIKPEVYLQLSPYFRSMTTNIRYEGQIYSFIVHTVHYDLPFRNSGFAWEPGGFGYILGIAIMFNIVRNSFSFSKKNITLLVVGLTTLSTTFYIFVLILLVFYLYERKKSIAIIYFSFPLIILIYIFLLQLPFMTQKIEHSMTTGTNAAQFLESTNETEAGRFAGLIYDYRRFIENPFGYGIGLGGQGKNVQGELITGASGFGNILRFWGAIGLIFLLYSLFHLSERMSIIYQNNNKLFVIIVILLFLFSNPIARDPIFLILIYIPLFVLKKINIPGKRTFALVSFVR